MTRAQSTREQARTEHLVAWIGTFTDLERIDLGSVERLAAIATEDVRFKDPFNDVCGYDALRHILAHTRRNVDDLRFIVTDVAPAGEDVYVRWDMTGRVRLIGDWSVSGVSHIRFAADGRVCEHVDYWDAAEYFYGRLPVIGQILAWLRGFARATPRPSRRGAGERGYGGRGFAAGAPRSPAPAMTDHS